MTSRPLAAAFAALFLLLTPLLFAASPVEALKARGFTGLKLDQDGRLLEIKAGGKSQEFTDADFAHLAGQSTLAVVELSGNFTDGGIAKLAGMTSIQKLILSSPAMTDAASATVATLTGLKELRLFGHLTSEWANPLAGKLPALEALTVNGRAPDGKFTFPRQTAAAFRHLPSFPALKALNPGQHHVYYINNEVIRVFAQCPGLEVINMGGSTWGGDPRTPDYSPLLRCQGLRTFVEFHASLYNDPTCAVLAQLPELRRVQLDFVTDEGARKLAALPNLERLTLGDSLLSPETVAALARCRSLRQLEISGPWSYAILDSLKAFPHLKNLVWSACPDGKRANEVLRAALPKTQLELTPGDPAALEAAWDKSVSRVNSRAQLAPFLTAAKAYRDRHPLPKAP